MPECCLIIISIIADFQRIAVYFIMKNGSHITAKAKHELNDYIKCFHSPPGASGPERLFAIDGIIYVEVIRYLT